MAIYCDGHRSEMHSRVPNSRRRRRRRRYTAMHCAAPIRLHTAVALTLNNTYYRVILLYCTTVGCWSAREFDVCGVGVLRTTAGDGSTGAHGRLERDATPWPRPSRRRKLCCHGQSWSSSVPPTPSPPPSPTVHHETHPSRSRHPRPLPTDAVREVKGRFFFVFLGFFFHIII